MFIFYKYLMPYYKMQLFMQGVSRKFASIVKVFLLERKKYTSACTTRYSLYQTTP